MPFGKCFGFFPFGKCFGFFVSKRGIEAGLGKIRVIQRMQTPKSVKDIQKLSGCIAYLSRFLLKMGEKSLPLYKLLKGYTTFDWTANCQKAFYRLKMALSQALLLVTPTEGETLFIYLAITESVVSVVICSLRNEKIPLVYCVSHVLASAETWYTPL